MKKIKDLNIGDLVLFEYKNKISNDISEVTGFVYKIKHKKIGLANCNPEKELPWDDKYVNYSIDRILRYEILKKSDQERKYDSLQK